MKFQIGDWVYAKDWCYGQIVCIDGDLISVEFDTGNGGGTCTFDIDDVVLAERAGIIPERTIKLELPESEFNMIIDKLKWMRCVVRDSDNLDYQKYCNGDCGLRCNRPDLCNFEKWFKSKVIE